MPYELAILVRIKAKMHYFEPESFPNPIPCGASILAPSTLDLQCPQFQNPGSTLQYNMNTAQICM